MKETENARQEPKTTLQHVDVHCSWSQHFRTRENDRFYGMAFDFIATVFGSPVDGAVHDLGCGSGTKSLHLAQRNYRVQALDFSPLILDEAIAAAINAGLAERITFSQGDLTSLTLDSLSVHRAVCWGVLMHIPDVSRAISELSRVVAPGGLLIISEGNFRSIQATGLRCLKRLLRRERAEVTRTDAGIEFWEETPAGRLMTRQADIPWLIDEFSRCGLRLIERRAGQFTEVYTLVRWKRLRLLIHALNHFWFRWIRVAGPAFGNILVLQRQHAQVDGVASLQKSSS